MLTNTINVFNTVTGPVNVGGGPVNLGASGSTTSVEGALTVAEGATLAGDLELGGSIAVSSDADVDVSSGAHSVARTANFVTTSHATNQVNLPDASLAGKM